MAIQNALLRLALFLLVLCCALGSLACVTGQTASEFFQPDRLSLGYTMGDSDVDGSFGRHGVPYGSDADMRAVTGTLGWDLSPSREAEAARATTRAVHMLAEVVAMQTADARSRELDVERGRCSGAHPVPTPAPVSTPVLTPATTTPAEKLCDALDARDEPHAAPKSDGATQPADPEKPGEPVGVTVDLESGLYAFVTLLTLIAGWLNRERIGRGARKIPLPRLRRGPK